MRLQEIENWALSIIERVESGQPIEDSRVELKTEWPTDLNRAARQIAGHANSAHGEPVLWLMGVDEKAHRVPGVEFTEFSNWYSSVKAAFSELPPEVESLNVPVHGGTVAALYFRTDRAPYVIKNPDGGRIHREVPWREGTSVQSATRSQLLRLLSPLEQLPDIEAVRADLKVTTNVNLKPGEQAPEVGGLLAWEMDVALFLTAPSNRQTVIAKHRCALTIRPYGCDPVGPTSNVRFVSLTPANVEAASDAATITGSAMFGIRCSIRMKIPQGPIFQLGHDALDNYAHLDVEARLPNTERPLALDIRLSPHSKVGPFHGAWSYGFGAQAGVP